MAALRWPAVCAAAATAAVGLASMAGATGVAAGSGPVYTQQNPGWGLSRLDERSLPLDTKYRMRASGYGVTAYLIDGGMRADHPELTGRGSIGVDLVGGTNRLCTDDVGVDHGTFVAGIVGGRTTGVAKRVTLVQVRALRCGDGVTPLPEATQRALIVKAVDWVRTHAHKPAVVNMSLNLDSAYPPLDAALRRLDAAGILAVVAAGNDASSACLHPPANVPTVLAVAASTSHDVPWSGSNLGTCVDLFAPGKDIKSAVADGGGTYWYAGVGATSWATPFVTGTAALYLQRHPTATPGQVRSWVLGNSTRNALTGNLRGAPNRLLYSFGAL